MSWQATSPPNAPSYQKFEVMWDFKHMKSVSTCSFHLISRSMFGFKTPRITVAEFLIWAQTLRHDSVIYYLLTYTKPKLKIYVL